MQKLLDFSAVYAILSENNKQFKPKRPFLWKVYTESWRPGLKASIKQVVG